MSSDDTPTPATAPAPARPWRRALRGLGAALIWILGWWPRALLALLLSLVLLVLAWAHSAGSWQQAWRWAAAWSQQQPGLAGRLSVQLPPDAPAQALLDGGELASLEWQRDGLALRVEKLSLRWGEGTWQGLLRGQGLAIEALSAARVELNDQRPATPNTPLESLPLPLALDIPFDIGSLRYQSTSALDLSGLQGRYTHRQGQHRLDLAQLLIAQGRYSGELRLQAAAPMALQARLLAQVALPEGAGPPGLARRALEGEALVEGTLAGADARLQAQARLHTAQPQGPEADLQAELRPWASQPLHQARLRLRQIDLALLWPGAPLTRLSGELDAAPAATGWGAQARFDNPAAGPWDKQRLPLSQLRLQVRQQDGGNWSIDELLAQIGGGHLQGQGRVQLPAQGAPRVQGQLKGTDINPAALHGALPAQRLDLDLQARVDGPDQGEARLLVQPGAGSPANAPLALQRLSLQARQQGSQWLLQDLQLHLPQARLQGQGRWNSQGHSLDSSGEWRLPGASGHWNTRLAENDGQAKLDLNLEQADRLWAWLRQATRPWVEEGAWPQDMAPQGQAELHAGWTGGWRMAQRWWQAAGQAGGPDWARLATLPPPPLELQWRVPRLALAAGADASRAEAWQGQLTPQAQGWSLVQQGRFLYQGHQLQLDSELLARPDAGGLQLSTPRLELQAVLARMPARYARWTLKPAAPIALRLADGEALLGAGELALAVPGLGAQSLALRWSDSQWRRATGLLSQGELRGLPLSWIDSLSRSERQPDGAMAEAGLVGDLLFDAHWNLALPPTGTAQARARLSIERRSGDLALRAGTVAGQGGALQAGIRAAAATLVIDGDALNAQLRWDSELAGQIDARLDSRWQGGLDAPQWPADAPLQGHLKAQLPQVGLWSALAPPGWRMSGAAQANATITGTRAAPLWNGELRGEKLALRSLVDGIEFVQGELQATLRGERLVIERLRIEGPGGAASGGSLVASGEASWQRGEGGKMAADMALKAQADKLRVSIRADRRLTVSGDVDGRLQGERLVLRGKLRADQASFVLPDESTPSLGSDVVVRRPGQAGRAAADGSSRVATDLHLTLDLGRQFEVRGHGLEARLEGQLELISTPAQPAPRVLGEVRTARGTYRAYGQRLDIEQGVLRFAGPYDNPALDVLAIRPYTTQRVGVQIRGTAQAPQVRLYSDPELPDSEKLAWLVLGRSASGGGAEAAVLQQAAMALLSGSGGGNPLGQLFGLDEVSVRGASTTTSSGGETVSGATLTLGKRLSNRLYVAYERSLAGTLGTFSIFYDVSRRLTLRARTGEDQAIDLIFTLPYD